MGLFFNGSGVEVDTEGVLGGENKVGDGGEDGNLLRSATSATQQTVRAAVLSQGVESFDDNPGCELVTLASTGLFPCSCC